MNDAFARATISMEQGYCLWVGAGVTYQVAGGYGRVPLWQQITEELEQLACLKPRKKADYPKRLQRSLNALGEAAFNAHLRRRYVTELGVALLAQAQAGLAAGQVVSEGLRAVARLGQLANPIVSFNIEPYSSLLLARPAGPVRIVYQGLKGQPEAPFHEPFERFQRLVYHPHGLALAAPVMTRSQYAANQKTLAYGQAIHAAFANTLVIVGMSLDDAYLRRQIERHRASVRQIFWFNNQFPEPLAMWAAQQDVTTVPVAWADFWRYWGELPIALDERELTRTWALVIDHAAGEAGGGEMSGLLRRLTDRTGPVPPGLLKIAQSLHRQGLQRGEAGQAVGMINGQTPLQINLALRSHCQALGWSTPQAGRTFAPD